MQPVKTSESAEHLSGSVERVIFHSEETGFCVLRIKARGHKDLITVVGVAASVSLGEYLECQGEWINDRTHGLQFKCQELSLVMPSTLEGIEKYLGSGMIYGIGPSFARKLVEAFGEQIFEIIEQAPERLLSLPGIGPKRKDQLISGWREQKAVRTLMVFLQSHGVSTARAVRIYKTYGDEAISKIMENPYQLALDIYGIGFKTADTIATKLGLSPHSPLRASAGIRHVLQELAKSGNCATSHYNLLQLTGELLAIPDNIIESAIADEIAAGNIIAEIIGDGEPGDEEPEPCVFLAPLYHAECGVASHLMRLTAGSTNWAMIEPEQAITQAENITGLTLSASQRKALALMLAYKTAVITGGPGVGKTTLVKSLLATVQTYSTRVLLCAPTGRAAKRLSEVTGLEAKTIHRLLEFDPTTGGFKRNADHTLETDLLVLDEASMVDVVLMNHLLRAIPDQAALLIVGDIDQLPSVGPGAVLADIINSERIPTIRLREIFRQAACSDIVVNAHRINQGNMPVLRDTAETSSDFYFIACESPEETLAKLMQVVCERIPQRFGFDAMADIQVLTPLNKGNLGTRSLNIELQKHLNPYNNGASVSRFGSTFAQGDKVIQTVNNYNKDVFNGDIGFVTNIDLEEGLLQAEFDDRIVNYQFNELDELSLAYAITIHKSQGSEYNVAVMPLTTQHYMLLERNLLYTGITRGKKLVVIIGQPKALAMAVRNKRAAKRLTNLKARLVKARHANSSAC